ncbi:phytoene/squalene synthase family protein [Luteimonas galliterrae]|uniref:phytoene/squalene synthase family protein n=1 Tax=Luteimonas galliterrae TaxID=2940486 RepID=UPI002019C616|nr:phytoene/squalene synthase family protein [Luteimonas galliterrae]
MNEATAAAASFLAKWRARWPEWAVAEVFVAAGQREAVVAWFALLQELTDAAWAGEDPTPGIAKLAWWQEELQGWSHGRRRHPLGALLQRLQVPWQALASALPALRATRTPQGTASALGALRPFAEAAASVEQVLLAAPHDPDGAAGIAASLLATHPHWLANAAEASALDTQWPARSGPRARRIFAALARSRLKQGPRPPWRALWTAWRAARH